MLDSIRFCNTSSEFVTEIVSHVRSGCSFTPFAGSGLSAPSGILMGKTFTEYLTYTMFLVLDKKLDVRTQGWPSYPSDQQLAKSCEFVRHRFDECLERVELKPRYTLDDKIDGFEQLDSGHFSIQSPELLRPLIPNILRKTNSAWLADEQLKEQCRINQQGMLLYTPRSSPFFSPSSSEYAIEKGIRSLHDWRATLEFFSEVRVVTKDNNCRLFMTEKDPVVIDRFNSHIVDNVQPTLGHKMLAHLSHRLRTRVLLTTNFDRLIEMAFEQLSSPLQVLEVRTGGHLPDPSTVRSQNSLIKLHGGLFETRADFTLDELPHQSDLRRFVDILKGSKANVNDPTHMLVVGFSGADLRIIQMIKHALNEESTLRLFWICFDEQDKERLINIFTEDEYKKRITAIQTGRPDLLLYELYQETALCLPGGGFSYEFTHKVPPLAYSRSSGLGDQTVTEIVKWMSDTNSAQNCFPKKGDGDGSWIMMRCESKNIFLAEFQSGATPAMELVFEKFRQTGKSTIWLELQDYPSVTYLADEIFRIIALRLGQHQSQHLIYTRSEAIPKSAEHKSYAQHLNHWMELLKHLGVTGNDWVLFLYGRNVPGACAGWFDHGWGKSKYEQLSTLFQILTDCGFTVIYLPFTKYRREREEQKFEWIKEYVKTFAEADLQAAGFPNRPGLATTPEVSELWSKVFGELQPAPRRSRLPAEKECIDESCFGTEWDKRKIQKELSPRKYETYIAEVMGQFLAMRSTPNEKNDMRRIRMQFLYVSTLFRHSRHISAFFSEATYRCPAQFNIRSLDNDVIRAGDVGSWVESLRKHGILFYKPGGYCWKHRDVRLGLQQLMEQFPPLEFSNSAKPSDPDRYLDKTGQLRSRSHFWIADWYMKAFMATGHCMPLLEAIYHFLFSAETACFAKPLGMEFSSDNAKSYRVWRFIVAVNEATKAMHFGVYWLRKWMLAEEKDSLFGKETQGQVKERLSNAWETTNVESAIKERGTACINTLIDEMELVNRALDRRHGFSQPLRMPSRTEFLKNDYSPLISPEKIATDSWNETGWDGVIYGKLRKAFGPVNDDPVSETKRITTELISIEQLLLKKEFKEGAENRMPKIVEQLSEYAYAHLVRAKMESIKILECDRICGITDSYGLNDEQERKSKTLWKEVSIICSLGLSLCRQIHPKELEHEQFLRAKLHTFYGLALGHLNRFFEAHRHLNEATAILSKTREGLGDLELAIIRLRRAEVYLVEAKVIREVFEKDIEEPSHHPLRELNLIPSNFRIRIKKPENVIDWQRLFYSCVDDATVNLDSAYQLLSGRSHSSLWWTRLLNLRMRAFSLIPFGIEATRNFLNSGSLDSLEFHYERLLLFRKRRPFKEMLRDSLRQGLLLSIDDKYRQLRIVEAFCRATWNLHKVEPDMTKIVGKDTVTLIIATMNDLKASNDRIPMFCKGGELQNYFSAVDSAVKKLEKALD